MADSRPSNPARDFGLTPARPARDRRDEPWPPAPQAERARTGSRPVDYDVDDDLRDLERGRTTALIAALGRLQLSVDLLTRNQQRAIDEQKAAISGLEAKVAGLAAALDSRRQ